MSTQYREIWRVPGAPVLLCGGVVARLGQGITVLAWLLLVRETTGSYGQAAAVGAMTSVAIALAAPVGGRLADRFGPARVLPWYALGYALSQLLLLGAVLQGGHLVLLGVIAFVSGAFFPPVGPALRAAWTVLTDPATGRSGVRTAAMAIESALLELVFVLGPLMFAGFVLAGGLIGTPTGTTPGVAGPAAALAAAAVCTLLGTTAVARGQAMRGLRALTGRPVARGLGPLRAAGMPYLLLITVGIAFSFGAAPVAIAAYAQARDGVQAGAVAGVLIAVWSLGSALAGLWFGMQRIAMSLRAQLAWLLIGLTVGYATWLLAPGSVWLGAVLLVTGAVIAPLLTVQAGMVAELSPPSMLNESFTWVTTTNLSSAALGSAATGLLIDVTGAASWGFVAATAAAGAAAVLAAWPRASVQDGASAEDRVARAPGATSGQDAVSGRAAL